MNIRPSISEIILAIITALLTFFTSLALLKVEKRQRNSLSKIEAKFQILRAGENDIRSLSKDKITSSQERMDAVDYLINTAPNEVEDVTKNLKKNRGWLPYIYFVLFLYVITTIYSSGAIVFILYKIYVLHQVPVILNGKIVLALVIALISEFTLLTLWLRKSRKVIKKGETILAEVTKAMKLIFNDIDFNSRT